MQFHEIVQEAVNMVKPNLSPDPEMLLRAARATLRRARGIRTEVPLTLILPVAHAVRFELALARLQATL